MIITQPDINLLSMTSPTYAKKNCYVSVAFFSSKKKKKKGRELLRCLTTRKGPGKGHEEVPKVIGMTNETPPAGHQQPLPCCCGNGLQSCRES